MRSGAGNGSLLRRSRIACVVLLLLFLFLLSCWACSGTSPLMTMGSEQKGTTERVKARPGLKARLLFLSLSRTTEETVPSRTEKKRGKRD